MRVSLLYNLFVRDFRKQKKRIALTLLALTWGTISIMLMLGFGEGLHQQLMLNSKGMGDNIVVMWGGQTQIPYKGFGKGRTIWFTEDDISYLKKTVPEIKAVGGEYQRWGIKFENGDHVATGLVTGVTPNYEFMRNHIPMTGGRFINDRDMHFKRRVVFLGFDIAEEMFPGEDPVGRQVMINSVPFTVIGVMIDKNQTNSYHGPDSEKMTIPLTTFKALYGDPWLDNLIYQVADPDRNKAIESQVYAAMSARHKFDPSDTRALSLWDTISNSQEMTNVLLGIKLFLGIIGGMTLLIAGVGVANIMYVSIKERTREIGVKMALGARKSHILLQFLSEALIITCSGGFFGMSISYIATELFKRAPIESDILRFMGRPTISLEIGLAVVVILGIMGMLAGFFPALRAASVSPVESLRYE